MSSEAKREAEMSRTMIREQTMKYEKMTQKVGFSRLKLKKALSSAVRKALK